MSEEVLRSIDADGVAIVTLNRPDKLNAITFPMAAAYAQTLRDLDDDPRARVIIVTGAGRGFCAGADLAELARTPELLTQGFTGEELAPTTALYLRKPVIAAVNGPTAGLGFVYALATDIRFVHPTATLQTAFAKLGLVAEYGLGWLLPRVIGYARATELLMSSRALDASEAVSIGLALRVEDDVVGAATAYARHMVATCSPTSWAAIKAQMLADGARPLADSLRHSAALMRDSFAGPDIAEALEARMAQRAPAFAALPGPAALDA